MQLEGLKIAVIEDDPIMGESLEQGLSLAGAEVIWWRTGEAALRALPYAACDVVLCDLRLPGRGGEQIFKAVGRYRTAPPFLFMTAFGDIDQAVRLLKKGAADYITKPFEMAGVFERIRALIGRAGGPDAVGGLGPSAAMLEIEQALGRVAGTRMPVLFTGETGVGKEVCARLLHGLTVQDRAPFVPFHCAAIPETAIETELFGTIRPARYRGYAERAGAGTLFLDGIADLGLTVQPKLLGLLESEMFFRIGDDTPRHFQARVVCSSVRDMRALVGEGTFREDLLFRINAVTVNIAPLRRRVDDIMWLAERFLSEAVALSGATPKRFTPAAEDRLLHHAWPGNARELRNRVERASVLCRSAHVLPADLFPEDKSESAAAPGIAKLSQVREAAEKRHIALALKARGGNLSEAARALGISRTTMWEKSLKYGLKTPTD